MPRGRRRRAVGLGAELPGPLAGVHPVADGDRRLGGRSRRSATSVTNRLEAKHRLLLTDVAAGTPDDRVRGDLGLADASSSSRSSGASSSSSSSSRGSRASTRSTSTASSRGSLGELSIFDDGKIPVKIPVYDHDRLGPCFLETCRVIEAPPEKIVASRFVEGRLRPPRRPPRRRPPRASGSRRRPSSSSRSRPRWTRATSKERINTMKVGHGARHPGPPPAAALRPRPRAAEADAGGPPAGDDHFYFTIEKEGVYWTNVVRTTGRRRLRRPRPEAQVLLYIVTKPGARPVDSTTDLFKVASRLFLFLSSFRQKVRKGVRLDLDDASPPTSRRSSASRRARSGSDPRLEALYEKARYPLVVLADEILIHSGWESRARVAAPDPRGEVLPDEHRRRPVLRDRQGPPARRRRARGHRLRGPRPRLPRASTASGPRRPSRCARTPTGSSRSTSRTSGDKITPEAYHVTASAARSACPASPSAASPSSASASSSSTTRITWLMWALGRRARSGRRPGHGVL